MKSISLTLTTLAVVAFADIHPTQAMTEGPWCGYTRAGRGYGKRCDLPTYEACRAWINAQPTSYCTQNPYYRAAQKTSRRKARHVAR
jgi:hypothetical protein